MRVKPRQTIAAAALALLLTTASFAAPLDGEIERLTSRGASARALWGVYAVELNTGKVLADVNGERMFVPASNRKLVSTAMAALFVKPGDGTRTIVHAARVSGGTVKGDLVVRAVGDPTFAGDMRGGRPGSAVLSQLARDVAAAGVTHVTGDLVIDTSRFADPAPMPPGWSWQDFQTTDGAMPAVFGIDKNLGRITIGPGSPGEPLVVQTSGSAPPFEVHNASTTARAGSPPTVQLNRGLDGTILTIDGALAADEKEGARSIPLGKPVEFAAAELLAALRRAGVDVAGDIRLSSSSVPMGQVLATAEMGDLAELLRETNIPSDNFYAESLYLLAGAAVYSKGSYTASRAAEEQFWKKVGQVDSDEWVSADGSGLSRKNHITPHALTRLLAAMSDNEAFVGSLPVSGKSGTIRYRLSDKGMAGRVRAKTGTLDGVSALSGYVTTNGGRTVAFSIIANNYDNATRANTIRATIDDIVELLAR